MSRRRRFRRRRGATAGASAATPVIWITFAYLLAGVNVINPLLPRMRADLGISTGGIATLYAVYLVVLVPLLLLLPRVPRAGPPRTRLLVAVALMAGADLMHTVPEITVIGIGRVLVACSIAVGTGAVAELAVLFSGERGRTVTATANTGGALAGTIAGGVVLLLATSPVTVVFTGHAVTAAFLLLLIVWAIPARHPVRVGSDTSTALEGRGTGRLSGLILGGFAFGSGALIIVLGASLFEQTGIDLGGRVFLVPFAMFIAAAIAQQTMPRSRRAIHVSGATTLAGLGLMLWALRSGEFSVLVLAAAVTGFGFGAVFVLGIAWTTHGVDARRQGALASAYSCIAYTAAALVTIGCGYVADLVGPAAAVLLIIVLSAASFTAWAVPARRQADPF